MGLKLYFGTGSARARVCGYGRANSVSAVIAGNLKIIFSNLGHVDFKKQIAICTRIVTFLLKKQFGIFNTI